MPGASRDIQIIEMKDAISELNNKYELLMKAFEETKEREARKDQTIEELKAAEAQKDQTIANLNEQVEYLTKKLFGRKSEKSDGIPGQLNLFNEAEASQDPSNTGEIGLADDFLQVKAEAGAKPRKKRQSAEEKYKNCRQKKEYLDVDEAMRTCPRCGSTLEYIGEEFVRREIRVVPGYVEVVSYYSRNYGCPICKGSGTVLPYIVKGKDGKPHMMKGMASASTVAWIMYQKYCNSVPLYRQEKDWERLYGLKIPRSTFANWVIDNADAFLKPVYDHMHRLLVSRDFLMGDETPLQVLHEPDRRAQTKSYMWVFRTGEDGGPPIILYNYSETRAGYNARGFLGDYSGYFMCDGFGGYNSLPNAKRCACWSHIRRYLLDAIPKGKKDDYSEPAVQGFMYVEKLFLLERSIREKNKGPDAVRDARNKKERPVLDAFFAWVDRQKPVKGSRLDKAIVYINNRRPYLLTYLEDGRCSLSNNLTEQGCKSMVIGRKNWLFSDRPVGASTSAMVYSLTETSKLNRVNPYHYLQYVFEKVSAVPDPGRTSAFELDGLMPWNAMLQEAIRSYRKTKDD